MCQSELECLQLINQNIHNIEAFCYALGVALAGLFFVYILNLLFRFTIGRAWS